MLGFVIALAAACAAPDPDPNPPLGRWCRVIAAVEHVRTAPGATLRARIQRLIERDEITRQHLWLMDDPSLSADHRRQLSDVIGNDMLRIDAENTTELKKLLPARGWFSNRVHGRQITHGAWLIAQHSPDDRFRAYALEHMRALVRSGDVDARDFALMFDRVQVHEGRAQRYGSQARCVDGRRALAPMEDESGVNAARERLGWGQTLEETKGDLEVGKPCSW